METVSSTMSHSSESHRMSDVMEKYTELIFGQVKNGADVARMPCVAQNFGDVDPLCVLSAPIPGTDFPVSARPDGTEDFLKMEPGPWEDITEKVFPFKETMDPEIACKFIKDEREPAVISALIPQNHAVLDVSTSSLTPLLDSNAGVMVDVPHPGALMSLPQVKPEAAAALRFDSAGVCKSETGGWDPHLWFSSALDDGGQISFSAPEGIHNSGLIQRSSAVFSAFPGVHTQRACVICGDEASGCHYGVLTCGSCKVFFKRAVEGHHNYLCAGRNDCIVDKIRRKNCPACRLRKCYQAGMMLGGRKLKRFGVLKAMGVGSSLMFQGHAMTSMSCVPGFQELQFSPQFVNILENIEPEMVYSGFDNSQPEMPHLLLNSLNRLCERQLLWIVRWSKSLPGFRNLHINDQMTLIQYSWMNLLVFSLGWRTFQNVTPEFMYFAPDLVLSHDCLRMTPIYDLCLAMQVIPQEFARLQVTRDEFLCMKALMLLNTVPLEGLKSQNQFDEMRQNYIRELSKAVQVKEKGVVGSSQRFYQLTKLMDSMHEIVKKVNLYCLSTFIQADAMKVEFPEMMTEVIASQLPKVLAGMVRPLLFHGK
ncbi:progesterone receptor [Silurus asotus]|uniref:Progesterone receptor n=1 Tax=Silurus asotus TaxID=30991 RepID=A0AAD5FP82_SILAS|nr:progesterone receptor [Silurus asotus]